VQQRTDDAVDDSLSQIRTVERPSSPRPSCTDGAALRTPVCLGSNRVCSLTVRFRELQQSVMGRQRTLTTDCYRPGAVIRRGHIYVSAPQDEWRRQLPC
jgi:hypothetical protein